MGDPWGIGGFRGGESPILSKSSTKKIGQKISKNGEIGKIYFFTENGLKCIRNPHETPLKVNNLSKKNIKSAKSEKNRKNLFFFY